MQGKGIIVLFLVLISLVCIWQYSILLPTRSIERNAEAYAANKVANYEEGVAKKQAYKSARINYLDSTSSDVVLNIPMISKYTYQDLKSKQLAGGLDLVGGMSVLLQVDLKDYLLNLAENTKDKTYRAALDKASAAQQSAQTDYISLFADAWREESRASGAKLSTILQRNASLKDQINRETSDGEIFRLLRERANETVNLTFNRLKQRIDKLGVVQPNVTLDASRDIISVELPGIDNPERARQFLQAAAKLEFWHVHRIADKVGSSNVDFYQTLLAADQSLKAEGGEDTPQFTEQTIYPHTDSLGNVDSTRPEIEKVPVDPTTNGGPLAQQMTFNTGVYGPNYLGFADKNKRKRISELLEQVQGKFPRTKFLWGRKPTKFTSGDLEGQEQYALYAIKLDNSNGKPPLAGDHITDSRVQTDPSTGEVQVSLNMDSKGATIWGSMTQYAYENGQREIAIVLDNEVVSAPGLRNGAILGGRSSISGSFTMQEGEDLSSILKIGKLPAETRIIQESLVGPSLGKENIRRSITSLIIGFGLVFLFMIFYYGGGGIVSIISLLLNIFFIFGALASFGTVLTLPGIAGIVLTIGMAVDANVIIFERIREELREGKKLRVAIQDGFSASYSAIIDANVTTILVAFILIYFGLGPIKGFAVVLAIGVALSVFTAVLVGRLIIDWWVGKGNNLSFWTNTSKNMFANLDIDWLGKKKMAYRISLIALAISFTAIIFRGFEYGVEFQGGYSYNVQFEEGSNISAAQLRKALPETFGVSTTVKAVDTENTYNVVTSYLINDTGKGAADAVINKLHEGINAVAGGNIDLENFKDPDGTGTHVTAFSKVGPTIADDITSSAKWATAFSLLFIFLYIFLRFSKWQYSMGAVAALFHDTVIVLGIFAIFHGFLPFAMEINQAFIAAILTVIGYSINDTVVVFDRIREFMGTYTGLTKKEIINKAINSTVSRTVITSVTTLFVVLILFIFGGGSIKGFAFALLVGILVGTYSSIFIATPVMSDLTGDATIKKETKKKSFSKALRT